MRRESYASLDASSDSGSMSEGDNNTVGSASMSIASAWGLRTGSPGTLLSVPLPGLQTPVPVVAPAGLGAQAGIAAAATAAATAATPLGGAGGEKVGNGAAAPAVTPAVTAMTRGGSYADVAKAALSPLTPFTPPPGTTAPPRKHAATDAQRSTIKYT